MRKKSTGEGDDYTTVCLLDFGYFEKNYRLIAANSSKQKALDADPKSIQQIIFKTKDLLRHWTIKRNNTRICKRNNKCL